MESIGYFMTTWTGRIYTGEIDDILERSMGPCKIFIREQRGSR